MERRLVRGENARLLEVVLAVVVVATLYLGRVVLVPLALALLFSLFLTPPVSLLERLKLPRILAILLMVAALVASAGLLGWKTSQQLSDLTNELPAYERTLRDKIHSLGGLSTQSLTKATNTAKELETELDAITPGSASATNSKKTQVPLGTSASRPLSVEVVAPSNRFQSAENMFLPLTSAFMVVVFTLFILVGREDLRNRLIYLAGGNRLTAMTHALDDATQRINRYLFLQLIVNCSYGLVIGIALHLIGIPNAALWGVSAAILRFLPYVGPIIGAALPILLSLAVFPGWEHTLATAGLFLVLELCVGNIVEPLLYGAHLGLSPLAVLVAAVFWTMLWGIPGLLLSTPITVCLVVLGRYLPGLSFLNILLGDSPALSPQVQYYQRLLAADQNEAKHILEHYLKEHPIEELYSSVVIPALALALQDRHRDELEDETHNFICQSTREIIEELDEVYPHTADGLGSEIRETSGQDVVCIPARGDADEVVALLLAQLLSRQGHTSKCIAVGSLEETLARVSDLHPRIACISALPPLAFGHARTLYTKLHEGLPDLQIFVCLWQFDGDMNTTATRLKLAPGHQLFTNLAQILDVSALRNDTASPHDTSSPAVK